MIGTVVGSYVVTGAIGEGGMGVVYSASHSLLGRSAAIKVLHPDLSRNQDIVNRFFNEARAATSIRHPGIVEVYDFGYLATGAAYIAMELLAGESLAARLAARPRMPAGNALWLARQIAGALSAAHGQGIVHRDLKPDNIFLIRDPEMATGERIKLLDFGIAKLNQDVGGVSKTRTGAVMGTPTYMAPEQCRGVTVDARADVYSLGCLLFEMICGRPPFTGEGMGDLLAAHITRPPPRPSELVPDLPEIVEDLILYLLEKDPAARAQSADHVIAMIDEMSAHVPAPRPVSVPAVSAPTVLTPTPPPSYRTPAPGVSTRPPSYRTPPPVAPSMPTVATAPTTLSGAAGSVGPAPARSRRGLVIGIASGLAAAGIALAVVLGGGGGGGAASPTPAAAPAVPPPDPAPVVEPIAAPAPEPVAEPVAEPAPAPEVVAEPEPVAEPEETKVKQKKARTKKKDRNAAYNPFD